MELKKLDGESYHQYIWRLDCLVQSGKYTNWKEITPVVNKELFGDEEDKYRDESAYRKSAKYARDFYEAGVFGVNDDEYLKELEEQKKELRKERMKLQTLNIERNRLDRQEARQELYYEYVGSVCNSLPVPEFKPLFDEYDRNVEYLAEISDLHFGAKFVSQNNEYSKEIAKERLELFLGDIIDFVQEKRLSHISLVSLGDTLAGLLRVNDLRINESSVVKATVEVSRIIAKMIEDLSVYCKVDYYHVPSANHTQTRNLNTKASELADEDLEYIIGNYIKDLCRDNERITVHLAENGEQYIDININGNLVVAGHGHTIKNLNTAIRDLSMIQQREIQYLLLGHFHGDKNFSVNESVCSDCEVIVAPSIVGSDGYSDSIMKGSKSAAKIYGFDSVYGLTEQYKYILN